MRYDLLHHTRDRRDPLHAPDREGMERETGKPWDALVVRRGEELRHIVGMADELLAADLEVCLNVNNHYEGRAPLTIKRIEEMLGLGNA